MKRDMDLIRAIMLSLEEHPEADLHVSEVSIEGHPEDEVIGHLILLEEAGFIEMSVERYGGPVTPAILVHRITWAGHEFLESVRSDSIWAKSTKIMTSAGIGLAWPLLQAVLRAKAAEHLGIAI